MEAKLKNGYIQEAQYQLKMIDHLKRWLRNFIIFSSISLILIIFGPSFHGLIRPIGIALMVISVLACIIIGLGIKNGQKNVSKIIDYIEK